MTRLSSSYEFFRKVHFVNPTDKYTNCIRISVSESENEAETTGSYFRIEPQVIALIKLTIEVSRDILDIALVHDGRSRGKDLQNLTAGFCDGVCELLYSAYLDNTNCLLTFLTVVGKLSGWRIMAILLLPLTRSGATGRARRSTDGGRRWRR